jgi:thiamine-monophosphate kinase
MPTEDQLVKKIAHAIPSVLKQRNYPGLTLGIGDDSAILSPDSRTDWVVSCDAFLEGVHFLWKVHPPDSVGYKSLVRAASDLVAMGATPQYFLMTLATVPRNGAWLDGFLAGMARAARSLGMRLIGGDTTRSRAISISITVIGEVARGHAITRSGARPGDLIYVTGRLGGAQLGLDLIRRKSTGMGAILIRASDKLLRPHLDPRIRVQLGQWLAKNRIPSAMMDISDGLSTDLPRLCAASRVGARVEASRIPRIQIPPNVARKLRGRELNPLDMALHGGDDYELLLAVPPGRAKALRRAPEFSALTQIGRITSGRKILLVAEDGSTSPLESRGWDPFRDS